MLKFSDRFEKMISAVLLGFIMFFILYQVLQLGYSTVLNFIERFRAGKGFEYAPEYGQAIAVLFFNVLLTMEIMQTIRVFSKNHIIKVRIILIVCLIAVSRKILALGEHDTDPMSEFSLAALILALSVGYFLVSRKGAGTIEEKEEED